MTSLVDAPPPRTTEGEKRLVKGERGDLRRSEGEGGRSRAPEARRRGGRRRERASGPMGNREESCERGERSGVGRGDFFSSLLVGPRITNPIRTSPPG